MKWEQDLLDTFFWTSFGLLQPIAFPAIKLLRQSSTIDQDIDNEIILLNHSPY